MLIKIVLTVNNMIHNITITVVGGGMTFGNLNSHRIVSVIAGPQNILVPLLSLYSSTTAYLHTHT